MSYAQFGYAPFPPTTQLMVGTSVNSNSVSSSPCCGGGGGAGSEPTSGRGPSGVPTENPTVAAAAAVLPATYETRLISTYPRLTPTGLYPAHPSPYADQPYPNFESSAFYPSLSSPYGMKDAADPWRGITPSSYYYDPSFAAYGYGGLDFNGARRKNVTRDSTSTLKAWLNEHRKNPYPTKGEKIMLAIITKMTLTQVSTWFANARRRLKKENKMTWEPRNKMDSDDVKDFDDDDDDVVNSNNKNDRDNDTDNNVIGRETLDNNDRRSSQTEDIRSSRSDSESSEDGGRQLTSGDNSVDGMIYRPSEGTLGSRSGYHLLRHPSAMPMSLCGRPDERMNPSDTGLPRTDFTPADSSSPSMPDIQSLMRSPQSSREGGNSALEDGKRSSGDQLPSGNGQDQMPGSKPKIWSLADTATSKTPPVAGGPLVGIEGSGTVAEMLGHCGWFSMNPYHHQVNGGSPSSSAFGGYQHQSPSAPSLAFMSPSSNGTAMFSNNSGGVPAGPVAHGLSPVPPQTDTPPQTPPNMKVSSALPSLGGSCSYNLGQNSSSHLYGGQATTAMCPSEASISSSMNAKSVNGYNRSAGNRTYRPELPEDFSSTGQYR